MYISGAKFEDHCFNISGDIRNSVFHRFSGTIYDVITSLICIIQKLKYPKKENTVLLYFERQPDLPVTKTPSQCSGIDLGLDLSTEETNNFFYKTN